MDTLFEDPNLHDNPILPGKNAYGDPNMENKYNHNLPEVHDVLKGLRQVADKYDAVLIGETWTDNIEQLNRYYGANGDELQMPMDFMFTTINKLSPARLSQADCGGKFRQGLAGIRDRQSRY